MSKLSVLSAVFNFARQKRFVPAMDTRGSWVSLFGQSPFNFQQDVRISPESVFNSCPLFTCMTLISGDIAKIPMRLAELQAWGGWKPVESPAFSPVLRKPNRFQNHIQFKEGWILSKLMWGNTYGLKVRDQRGVVVQVLILDPCRVTPLLGEDGSIWYRLGIDHLTGVVEPEYVVPASEIIHDRWNCLFHPLVGLSPIYAAALPALQNSNIGTHLSKFFGNNAQPGGILTAPGAISPDTATRLKTTWETNYTGINAGRVAVMGDGLQFKPLSPSAVDSQIVEQMEWTARTIAAIFHVPAYKLNVGSTPNAGAGGDQLDLEYYKQCLQVLIESFEICMDEGLGLSGLIDGRRLGVELDLSALLKMDTPTKMKVAGEGVGDGVMCPNEARAWFDLPPKPGGDTPYLQQQNFSLAALAKRDSSADPFAKTQPALPAPKEEAAPTDEAEKQAEQAARELLELIQKGFTHA